MMHIISAISMFLCFCSFQVSAQNTYVGRVSDALNGEALGYVSIGIAGTNVGTVAAPNGNFTLQVPTSVAVGDSVAFSFLGYATKKIALKDLSDQKENEVELDSRALQIRQVEIRPDQTKMETLGKGKIGTKMQVNFALNGKINQNLGSEIGRRFKISKPSRLEKFQFYLSYNNFDTAQFRLNIRSISDGNPNEYLTTEHIMVTVLGKKTGWVDVDLRQYQVSVDENIIVSVEWVFGSRGGTVLAVPIAMPVPGSQHFYKFGSKNNWKRFRGMSAAFQLDIRR